MFQLSDQQDDGRKTTPAGPNTVKKGYPGLVLVPPSDRTILRRRLVRGALVLVAVIWTISTFTSRPPDSDNPAPCQSEGSQSDMGNSPEKCGTPSSTAVVDTPPSEAGLTQISQAAVSVEASPLPAVPQPAQEEPQVNPLVTPRSPESAESIDLPSGSQTRTSDHEKPAAHRLPEKPVVHPENDTHLAEQGDPFAQYRLGRRVAQQEGRQAPESVSWYKKAFPGLHRLAETGNGQAMYVLGVMYAYGRGVEKDISQARRWLTRAVDQKITAAQPVLASLPQPARSSPNLQIHAAESVKTRKQQN
jgi:hypothetical protein